MNYLWSNHFYLNNTYILSYILIIYRGLCFWLPECKLRVWKRFNFHFYSSSSAFYLHLLLI